MIAVFFGGRSCEHDISVITGLQALSACGKECVPVYIDSDGLWWTGNKFDSVNAVKRGKFGGKRVHIRAGEPYLYAKNKRLCKIDVALLCMHGMLGEDGSLQGYLEMCGIAYTGSGVLASAIGMNKLYSKRIFEAAGIAVAPYVPITRAEYERDVSVTVKEINGSFGFPVIVKPCNLGSSIGISVAHTATELYAALRVAFEWDNTVIIEKAFENFTEVNCAVLGDGSDVAVSETEQPVGWECFLTFADKYSGDVKATRHKIPAEISAVAEEKVKALAVKAFGAVGCSGVARVDFLVLGDDVYVNEINTIPGSLASALFAGDKKFSQLIDSLVDIAIARHGKFEKLKRTYTPIEPIIGK